VLSNGEGGSNMATPQQQEMIAAAGRRAADDTLSDNVSAHASVRPAASSPSPRERSACRGPPRQANLLPPPKRSRSAASGCHHNEQELK